MLESDLFPAAALEVLKEVRWRSNEMSPILEEKEASFFRSFETLCTEEHA